MGQAGSGKEVFPAGVTAERMHGGERDQVGRGNWQTSALLDPECPCGAFLRSYSTYWETGTKVLFSQVATGSSLQHSGYRHHRQLRIGLSFGNQFL